MHAVNFLFYCAFMIDHNAVKELGFLSIGNYIQIQFETIKIIPIT